MSGLSHISGWVHLSKAYLDRVWCRCGIKTELARGGHGEGVVVVGCGGHWLGVIPGAPVPVLVLKITAFKWPNVWYRRPPGALRTGRWGAR